MASALARGQLAVIWCWFVIGGALCDEELDLRLKLCDGEARDAMNGYLVVDFPEFPEYGRVRLPITENTEQWFTTMFTVKGSRPAMIRMWNPGSDGICIAQIVVNDRYEATPDSTGETGLPVTLASRCGETAASIPCTQLRVFHFPPETSTTHFLPGTQMPMTSAMPAAATLSAATTTPQLLVATTQIPTTRVSTSEPIAGSGQLSQAAAGTTASLGDWPTMPTAPVLPVLGVASTFTETTTTRTTTMRPQVPVPPPAQAALSSAFPKAFFAEFQADVVLSMKYRLISIHPWVTRHYKLGVQDAIRTYAGLRADSAVQVLATFKALPSPSGTLVTLHFRVPDDNDIKVDELVDMLHFDTNPEQKARFNAIIADIPPFTPPATWPPLGPDEAIHSGRRLDASTVVLPGDELEINFTSGDAYFKKIPDFPDEFPVFTCVECVVYAVIANAAVLRAYKYNFLCSLGMVLGILAVTLSTRRRMRRGTVHEQLRGHIVVPLFMVAVFFQSCSIALKAYDKFQMLLDDCHALRDDFNREGEPISVAAASCPPSFFALIFELGACAAATLVASIVFVLFFWRPRWLNDCAEWSGFLREPVQSMRRGGQQDEESQESQKPLVSKSADEMHEQVDDRLIAEEEHWEPGEPIEGDRVEVILEDRWYSGSLVKDRRADCPTGHRWVVRLESGELVEAPFARRLAHEEPAARGASPRTNGKPAVVRSLFFQAHVTPLQSVMRRGRVLTFMEVQAWDHLSSTEHRYLLVLDILVSYSIVLTAFFCLQKYELPGVLTAWHPYKLIFELVVAAVLRSIFRVIVDHCLVGAAKLRFIQVCVALFFLFDLSIWIQIYYSFRAVHSNTSLVTWQDVVDILDVTVGAGLINFLLAKLSVTFGMLLLSAYVYEPLVRHRYQRTVRLTSTGQVLQLMEELEADRRHDLDKALVDHDVKGAVGWKFMYEPVMLVPSEKHGQRSLPWSVVFPKSDEFSIGDYLDAQPEPKSKSARSSMCSGQAADDSDSEEAEGSSDDAEFMTMLSRSSPIVVNLRRAANGMLLDALIWLVDLILSVDVYEPVIRSPSGNEGDWTLADGLGLQEDLVLGKSDVKVKP